MNRLCNGQTSLQKESSLETFHTYMIGSAVAVICPERQYVIAAQSRESFPITIAELRVYVAKPPIQAARLP